jgi:hypothetical protein
MKDGIYRASLRGDSTYIRARAEAVAAELLNGGTSIEPGKAVVVRTRKNVEQGWYAAATGLFDDGQSRLAVDVLQFIDQFSAAKTDRELLADSVRQRLRHPPRRAGLGH